MLRRIRNALRGIVFMLRTQSNARIHAVATIAVGLLGAYFRLERLEWACLALAVTLVWSAEAFNTALERLGDAVSSEHHPLVGQAKDIAAGAVLLTAFGAVIVGIAVLGARVVALLSD